MTSRVSVAVMHDPRRASYLPPLLDALDVDAAVVTDRYRSRWDTGRRALLARDPAATHHLVIQDDAVPCRDLVAGVHRMLDHVPAGHPLCLYFAWQRWRRRGHAELHDRAVATGRAWIVMPRSPMWGVALVLPAEHIPHVVAHADKLSAPAYDGRVRRWYVREQIDQWIPVPSPVDHRCGPGTSSLTADRRNDDTRHAMSFVGADRSALDFGWAGPPVRTAR